MDTLHNTLSHFFKNSNPNNATSSSNDYFTCEICREIVLLEGKFRCMEASGCFHPYCADCVAKYIEIKVIDDNMSDIKCPNTDCSVLLDALSCRSILSKKIFEKWCRVLCESRVLLDASKGGFAYGMSFCPNRKCSEMILNECVEMKSMVRRSDCPNCKKVFCFSCMVPWKENHWCRLTGAAAIDIDMDRNDILFIEMIKRKKLVRCPNCNICIKRYFESDGHEGYCSHMYCRCGTQFCYDCREWPCVCREEDCTCCNCLKRLLVGGLIFGFFGLTYFLLATYYYPHHQH